MSSVDPQLRLLTCDFYLNVIKIAGPYPQKRVKRCPRSCSTVGQARCAWVG